VLIFAVGAALVYGSAVPVAVAMVIGSAAVSVFAFARFTPWRAEVSGSGRPA
jgi:hypothetical protein